MNYDDINILPWKNYCFVLYLCDLCSKSFFFKIVQVDDCLNATL